MTFTCDNCWKCPVNWDCELKEIPNFSYGIKLKSRHYPPGDSRGYSSGDREDAIEYHPGDPWDYGDN